MKFDGHISRRTVLRGLGTAVALPLLDAMLPRALANPATPPRRMAFCYVPNGVNTPDWTPKAEGAGYELTPLLKPLAAVKEDVLVLTGLTADKARPNGDGPGDHARASAAFLTGCQPRKTSGADIHVGVSVDQYAAARIGDHTRLPSLEIGTEPYRPAGSCDSGYACVYSTTMSWRTPKTPVPIETNPRQVFDRLFSSDVNDPDRQKRNRRRTSVLDLVLEDARGLSNQLGSADQRKLDEYLSCVREIEMRIQRSENLPPLEPPAGAVKPAAVPGDLREYLRLMSDLLVLAFRTDVTRVAAFMFAREGSNRPHPFLGVSEGHHELTHHEGDPEKVAKIKQINTFHVEQFAYLIGRLKDTKEGGGTLLDHCMIAYGSGNGDGSRHNHDDLPILLAGRGGGTLKTGRHVRYPHDTPLNNLWLSMLERVGVRTDKFGDSTGRLPGLA